MWVIMSQNTRYYVSQMPTTKEGTNNLSLVMKTHVETKGLEYKNEDALRDFRYEVDFS